MADPMTAVVEGDAPERRTRETYAAWMSHGLDVVRRVAARPGSSGDGWPDARRGPELPRTRWTARPYGGPDAIRTALDAGWLVCAGDGDASGGAEAGPLSGMAVAVKDIVDVAGLPTSNGTPGLRTDPRRSAPAWTRLAAAGARCAGKAATHEMAWGVTTPQIANPLAADLIAGGSSGGSAACVAAGVAPGALGTDTGGSLRIPAALCGVVGFRPTTGRVPGAGITALAPMQDVPGPIAADVPTCAAMLEVLLGRGLGPERTGVAGTRIGVLAEPGRLQPPVRRAYQRTLDRLADAGARIVPCETGLHREAGSVSLVTMLLESARLHAAAVRAAPGSFGGEARALLTLGEALGPAEASVRAARSALQAESARLFADARLDAFVTPTTPCVAPPRGAETVPIEGRDEPVAAALTRFTAWAAVATMPAVSVPAGSSGLPVGVQVMGPPDGEHVCVRVALAIEAASAAGTASRAGPLDRDSDLGCDE